MVALVAVTVLLVMREVWKLNVNLWWPWCSGNTEACGAFISGSTPDGHPTTNNLSCQIRRVRRCDTPSQGRNRVGGEAGSQKFSAENYLWQRCVTRSQERSTTVRAGVEEIFPRKLSVTKVWYHPQLTFSFILPKFRLRFWENMSKYLDIPPYFLFILALNLNSITRRF